MPLYRNTQAMLSHPSSTQNHSVQVMEVASCLLQIPCQVTKSASQGASWFTTEFLHPVIHARNNLARSWDWVISGHHPSALVCTKQGEGGWGVQEWRSSKEHPWHETQHSCSKYGCGEPSPLFGTLARINTWSDSSAEPHLWMRTGHKISERLQTKTINLWHLSPPIIWYLCKAVKMNVVVASNKRLHVNCKPGKKNWRQAHALWHTARL